MNKERGIAIPMVLVALVALSALALAMTVATRSEVVTAGVQTMTMRTLQAADAALNFGISVAANFSDPVSQPLVSLRSQGETFDATIKVDYVPPRRLPPPGIRVSALKVSSYIFRLTSQGYVPSSGGQPNSATNLEMEASKLGPNG